jgi:hypothetical protein
MTEIIQVVLIAAAIVYMMVRRLMGEPAVGTRLVVLPAVLGGIGLTQVSVHSASTAVFLAVSAALSVVFGLLRGLTVRVYEQNGLVMLRYTAVTMVLWAASFVARLAAGFVMNLVDPSAAQFGNGLMLGVGAGLLAEGLVLLAKAARVPGRVLWSTGRRRTRHRTPAFLDSSQQKVHAENGHDSSR